MEELDQNKLKDLPKKQTELAKNAPSQADETAMLSLVKGAVSEVFSALMENVGLSENPLKKDFIDLQQAQQVFSRYKPQWIISQINNGNLQAYRYGRDGILLYVPEVRQAILEHRLEPVEKEESRKNDKRKKTQKRRATVRGSGESLWAPTVKDFCQKNEGRKVA